MCVCVVIVVVVVVVIVVIVVVVVVGDLLEWATGCDPVVQQWLSINRRSKNPAVVVQSTQLDVSAGLQYISKS